MTATIRLGILFVAVDYATDDGVRIVIDGVIRCNEPPPPNCMGEGTWTATDTASGHARGNSAWTMP